MFSTAIEIFLGALIAIITTIVVEKLKKPSLSVQITNPIDMTYPNAPAKYARFLHIEVRNQILPVLARWMSRASAERCYGTITFYHLDGQNIFGRSLLGRWHRSPEPVPIQVKFEEKMFVLLTQNSVDATTHMDIQPGEAESFVVAAKFDDDQESYGWGNENYFSNPAWRNPKWKLASGRYLVKVTITSAGDKVSQVFRIINDVERNDFRLEASNPRDKVYD